MDQNQLYSAPLLTAAAVNYKNRAYVAHLLAPIIGVARLNFNRVVFDRASRFKPADLSYGKNGQASLLDLSATKIPAAIVKTALAWLIDETELEEVGAGPGIVGAGFPLEALKTDAVMEQHFIGREMQISGVLRSTAVNPNNTTLSGTSQWSDYVNSDPGAAIISAADSMLMKPNVLWGSRPVISTLRRHPKILDVTKYTERGKVSLPALADYFEVDEIVICEAFYDSARVGQAESRQYIWGKDAGLMYKNPNPQPLMEQPSAMYLFQHQPAGSPAAQGGGQGQAGRGFRVYRGVPQPSFGTGAGSIYGKVEKAEQAYICADQMTFLFKNAIA